MSLLNSKIGFWVLLLLPMLVAIFFGLPFPPWPDAIMYDSIMRDFLQTGIFRCLIFSDFDPSYVNANFDNGPLYTILHLSLFQLFGTTDGRLMILTNYALILLSTINVARILNLQGRLVLLLVLILFNPFIINSAGLVRPEWLNVFFLSWIWRLFVCHRQTISQGCFATLVGLLLALSAQTHYFSIFFVPIISYEIWCSETTIKKRLIAASGIAVAATFFLLPYFIYLSRHYTDFQTQVMLNQFTSNTSRSLLQVAWHFFQPIIFPSTAIFTTSHAIPTWLPNIFPLSALAFLLGITIKLNRHILLSPTTRQAIIIWLILGAGTSILNYMPYVLFYFSVATIAVWKDLIPHLGNSTLRIVAIAVSATSLIYGAIFYTTIRSTLFTWTDHHLTTSCLSDNIPANETVYVMAYPDPSVALSNMRPDIRVRRYSDFSRYATAWATIVKKTRFFITSLDETFLRRFDHGGALFNKIRKQELETTRCTSGPVTHILWTQHP